MVPFKQVLKHCMAFCKQYKQSFDLCPKGSIDLYDIMSKVKQLELFMSREDIWTLYQKFNETDDSEIMIAQPADDEDGNISIKNITNTQFLREIYFVEACEF